MADLRIVDAPEIPTNSITGEEKLPTGGSGNYSISLDSLAEYTKTKKDLADNTSVDNKVNGVRQELDSHIEDLINPHQVTKGQIGLGNVDNTADLDKPVSNSTQAAIISAVTTKADKSYVDNALSSKSDKTYVDNQLTLKANKADAYTKQESNDLVNNSISTALTPINTSLDLAKRGIANRYDSSLTYNSGERVVLANGDIVKSLTPNNTNNPNISMLGWVKIGNEYVVETIADLLLIQGMKSGNIANVLSYRSPNLAEAIPYRGGGRLVFDASKIALNDGVSVFNGWVRVKQEDISPFSAGAVGDGVFDDQPSFQKAVNYLSSIGGGTLYLPIPRVSYFLNSKTDASPNNPNAIVQWKPNVSVKGEGKKSKIKVGAFSDSKFYMFYNYTEELGDISFENFSVDANGQNNLPPVGIGYDQWIIATAKARSVTIERVHVSNAGGQQIFSIGSNVEIPTVGTARISKCNIEKVATDITGNIQQDHSSFYVSTREAFIIENVLSNDASGGVATAIECHSIKQTIRDNIVTNYKLGVITAAWVRDVEYVQITGNKINAMMAWEVYTSDIHTVHTVDFYSNKCKEVGSAGQHLIDLQSNTYSLVHELNIYDNTLRGSGRIMDAQAIFGILIGKVKNLNAYNNKFKDIVGSVMQLGTGATSETEVDFHDNRVINCNTTTNMDYKDIIAFNTNGTIKRLSINNNKFRSDNSTFSKRIVSGVAGVDVFEFTGNKDLGNGFTSIANWYEGMLGQSAIDHTTKLQGKPTIAASPLSKWNVTSAPFKTYQRFGGDGVNNVWHTTHYVTSPPPVAGGLVGDRAINMLPSIGKPSEWVLVVEGWAATPNLVAVT